MSEFIQALMFDCRGLLRGQVGPQIGSACRGDMCTASMAALKTWRRLNVENNLTKAITSVFKDGGEVNTTSHQRAA